MRIAALAVLALGSISLAAPAQAGTYGSNYPVCLQVYGPLNYYECAYSSIHNATCRPRGDRRNASSIRISQAPNTDPRASAIARFTELQRFRAK